MKHGFFSSMKAFASVVLVASYAAGCSSSDAATTPPPTPESLFDAPPAATPGKLRGLYTLATQQQAGGDIEVRVRFIQDYAVGAAKCTPAGGGTPVIAGKSISMQTDALEAGTGKLTMGALVFQKQEGNLICGGGIQQGGTFDFTVDGTSLTLTLSNAKLTATKIGD